MPICSSPTEMLTSIPVTRVLSDQAAKLIHCSNLFHNPWAGALASLLVDSTKRHGGLGFAPGSSTNHDGASSGLKVFLANSGSEANVRDSPPPLPAGLLLIVVV